MKHICPECGRVTNAFRLRAADRQAYKHALELLRCASPMPFGGGLLIAPLMDYEATYWRARSPMPFGGGLLIATYSFAGTYYLRHVTNAFRLRAADRHLWLNTHDGSSCLSPMPFGGGLLIAQGHAFWLIKGRLRHQCLSAEGCGSPMEGAKGVRKTTEVTNAFRLRAADRRLIAVPAHCYGEGVTNAFRLRAADRRVPRLPGQTLSEVTNAFRLRAADRP